MHKTSMQHFFYFFRNADSVRVVSFSNGSGHIRATKYTSCIFEAKFLGVRLWNGSPYAIRPLSVCLSVLSLLSVCDVSVSWQNGCMDQDESWHWGRPRPRPYCDRWEPSSPSRKGTQLPIFGQTDGWMKMPLMMEVGLGRGHIVLDMAKLPSERGTTPPCFRPMPIVAKRSPVSAIVELLFINGAIKSANG